MKSWPKVKLGKVIICSNLVLSTLIWPQILYPYLALVTYSLALITIIWAYLPLIDLIWPYVLYSPSIDISILRLHLCAKF